MDRECCERAEQRQTVALDALQALERDEARLFAGRAWLLVELDRAAATQEPLGFDEPVQGARRGELGRFDADVLLEVAGTCRLGQGSAGLRLSIAIHLVNRLPVTRAALAAGELFVPQARVILEETVLCDVQTCAVVEALVWPAGRSQCPADLRRRVKRAVLRAGVATADVRHRLARADRGVSGRALPDGMGQLTALLPAEDLRRFLAGLDDLARAERAVPDPCTGGPRTADQLRADMLTSLPGLVLHRGVDDPPGDDLPGDGLSGSAASSAHIPDQDLPGSPAGSAPIPDQDLPSRAAHSHPDRDLPGSPAAHPDPPIGSASPGPPDTTGSMPAARNSPAPPGQSGPGSGARSPAPPGQSSPESGATSPAPPGQSSPAPPGQTGGAGGVAPGSGPSAPAGPGPAGSGGARGCGCRTQVFVHVPVNTALGISAEPAELVGYGPVGAEQSSRLLDGADLRRVDVDALTGEILAVADRAIPTTRGDPTGQHAALIDLASAPPCSRDPASWSEPQHDPSAALARLVLARYRHCDGPGCAVPAARCDLDHEQPWPAGPTSPSNLRPRSRRCHRAKTFGWVVRSHPDGSSTWTSPLGRSYTRSSPWQIPPALPTPAALARTKPPRPAEPADPPDPAGPAAAAHPAAPADPTAAATPADCTVTRVRIQPPEWQPLTIDEPDAHPAAGQPANNNTSNRGGTRTERDSQRPAAPWPDQCPF